MTSSRLVRTAATLLLLAVASIAGAATTEFRVFFDTDHNSTTGCTVGGMSGVEQVLTTVVADAPPSGSPGVTSTQRQLCTGSALGAPIDVDASGWPAAFGNTTRELTFETRIRLNSFGSNGIPQDVRLGFQTTRGSATHTSLLDGDGSDIVIPEHPVRRRAVGSPGSPRTIVLDGLLGDWNGIDSTVYGIASDGTRALRVLRVFSWFDPSGNPAEKYLYFAVIARLSSDMPYADDDIFTRRKGQNLAVSGPGVLQNDGDPFGQPLEAIKVTDPERGSVSLNGDGSFTYSPHHPQVMTPDEFEYKVKALDNRESNVARVEIRVTDAQGNDPPSFTAGGDVTVDEDSGPYSAPWATAISAGGDELTAAFTVTNDNNTLFFQQPAISPAGTLTFEPADDANDSALVTVKLINSDGASTANVTFFITVTPVNDAPTFIKGPNQSVPEDSPAQTVNPWATAISPGPSDEAGETVAFTVTGNTNPSLFFAGPFVSATGVLTYTPAANAHGTATITVTATDTGAPPASSSQQFTITITPVNDNPSFTAGGDVTVGEDSGAYSATWATNISAGPNEPSQTVSFTVTNDNNGLFSAQPAIAPNGTLTFTPAANAVGSAIVSVTLFDNLGGSSAPAVTFTINVTLVNDPPSFVKGADQTVNEDAPAQTVNPWATAISPGPPDESGQTVAFNVTGNTNPSLFAAGPLVDPAGVLTYTPAANANGVATITITLTDNGAPPATSAPQSFTITVNAVNDAPKNTVPAAQTTNEDTPLTFSVGAGNPIQIDDVDAGAGSLQVTLAVTNGTLTADSGAAIANNNTATVTLTGTIANINASLDGLVFNPTANINGLAQLTITTNDQGNSGSGGALQDVDIVDINVLPVNDQPVVNAATFSLDENSANATTVGSVTFTDNDPADTHTFAITAGNTGGAFAINLTSGAITVANSAALDFESTPTFSLTVTVTDNSGAGNDTGSATITVNLNNLNEAPVANDATFALDENSANGTAVGTVTATDQDAGQTLSYAITAGNTLGAFAINASSGAITVADVTDINYEVNPTFSLTVTVTDDGTGNLTDTATITVNLNNLNEAPIVNPATVGLNENSPNGTSVTTATFNDQDTAQTHTFSITAGNTGGAFAINSGTGEITVATVGAVDFETNPTFSLTVDVTDNGSPVLNDTATITINLNDLNENPVVNDQTFSVDENSANGTVVGTVVATDQDAGQTLSYAITAGNALGAFAINSSSGQITVADVTDLDFETNPTFSLTVQVTDNGAGNLTDTATITVNLNDLNEAPTIVTPLAPANVTENAPNGTSVTTILGNDPDSGQTLTWSITAGNTGGAFAINPSTGEITVANSTAVDFETNPSFTLTVQATDNGTPAASDTETVFINVNNINEAPVVNAATFSLPENSPNGTSVGTATFSDQDAGQTGTFAITAGNTGGAFAIDANTGAITVANVAAVDFETNPTFSLTVGVTDNGVPVLTGSNTITVNLTNANEAPVVNDQSFNVDENSANGTVVGSIAFSDPDGPTDTFAITAGNAGGEFAVNPSTGQITVTAALNYEAATSYVFTVTVSDAGTPLGTDTAQITITINNLNEAPVVNAAGPFSVAENSANGTNVGTPITFTEPDAGQTHSYSITAGNTGGAFAIDGSGQISVATSSALNFETTPSFSLTVQVTDDGTPNMNDSTVVVVNLSNVNDAPVVNDQSFNVAENSSNGTVVGTVVATDDEVPATQTLTYSITTGNTGGAFAINSSNGQITVANPINYESLSSYSLTVQVQDNGAGNLTDTATVTITVLDMNEPPVANDASFNVDENSGNGTVVGTVSASDPDAGQTLTYAITAGNTGGAFAINSGNGQITVANTINFESLASYSLTVTVTDNGPGTLSDPATISITVNNVNEAPVVNAAGPFTLAENSANATSVGTPITFTDPDAGQTHTYSITAGNTGGAFAIDNSGQITVANSAAVNYEATPSFTLTVTVTDAGLPNPPNQTGSTSVVINLTDVNDAPVYSDAARSIDENSANGTNVGLAVTATDEDLPAQTLTYSITGGNALGAFAINGSSGQITVADAADVNFEVNPSFVLTVQVQDNGTGNLTDTATVTITVNDVNEAPVLDDATRNINENSANGTNVGLVLPFTDPDTGQTHTFAITGGNALGAFAISNAGQITVADVADVNFEVNPQFVLTVQITDNGTPNLSDTATVTIDINDVNEAPTADDDTYNNVIGNTQHRADGGAAGSIAVAFHTSAENPLTGDVDPDTNPSFNVLSVQPVTNVATNQGGKITIDANGKFTYTPAAGFTGADFYDYTLSDGTNTDIGRLLFTVSNLVWYVKNDDAVGPFTGTSTDPFNELSDGVSDALPDDAEDAVPTVAGTANTIYVFKGNGTTSGMNQGITLDHNQDLLGEAVSLVIASTTLVTGGPANRPLITNTAGNAVSISASAGNDRTNTVRGLSISGAGAGSNAIDATATGGIMNPTIDDVVVTSTVSEGIDINMNPGSTSTIALSSLNVTAGTTGIDINNAGTARVSAFSNITVTGATAGSGILVNNVRFDTDADGSPDAVPGGNLAIGASGATNGVGAVGMQMTNVTGDVSFTDADIFTDGGAALTITGTTPFGLTVIGSAATLSGVAGAAADLTNVAASIPGVLVTSTNSGARGVSLTTVTGTFTANSGSAISNAAGTDFFISGGSANVTYPGTITDDLGQLMSIANATAGTKLFTGAISDNNDGDGGIATQGSIDLDANTGATITISGGLLLSTGANNGIQVSGGGTVNICAVNPCGGVPAVINTLTATTGVPLRFENTNFGTSGLTFRSIASNGAASGIVVDTTGANGGLTITGTGTDDSGGSILSSTQDAVFLNSTRNISLTQMNIATSAQSHIDASTVTGLTLNSVETDLSTDDGIKGSLITTLTVSGCTFDRGGAGSGVGNVDGVNITNLRGTSSITSTTFMRSNTIQMFVLNNTATVGAPSEATDVLTVSGTTWNTHNGPFAGDHLSVQSDTGGNFKLIVDSSTAINNFTTGGIAVQATSSGTGTMKALVTGVNATAPMTAGVAIGATASGNTKFDIFDNKTANGTGFSGMGSVSIAVTCVTAGACNGFIRGNTVTHTAGAGVDATHVILQGNGTANVEVSSNVVSGNFQRGFYGESGTGSGKVNLNFNNNNYTGTANAVAGALQGVNLQTGNSAGGPSNQMCLDMFSNSVTMVDTTAYRLRNEVTSPNCPSCVFQLKNYAGGGSDTAAISNWITNPPNSNTFSTTGTPIVIGTNNPYTNSAGCTAPTI